MVSAKVKVKDFLNSLGGYQGNIRILVDNPEDFKELIMYLYTLRIVYHSLSKSSESQLLARVKAKISAYLPHETRYKLYGVEILRTTYTMSRLSSNTDYTVGIMYKDIKHKCVPLVRPSSFKLPNVSEAS